MSDCCKHRVHAQIEYMNANGMPIETLLGTDPKESESRKLLHAMLDEWIDRRTAAEGKPDHFIVYGTWPKA
jgi:hypothetical protein